VQGIQQVLVEQVLRNEKEHTATFVPRDREVAQIKQEFIENRFLDAVLITRNGDPNQPLLGIATRWDVAGQ
jgi:hypothetical protein